MDEVIRVSFGENAEITCALYNGNFSKTLKQAQQDKHDYILDGIAFKPGARLLDIGCGWGPVLKAVKERGGRSEERRVGKEGRYGRGGEEVRKGERTTRVNG